jgi:hypothetical protein
LLRQTDELNGRALPDAAAHRGGSPGRPAITPIQLNKHDEEFSAMK